MQEWNTEDSSNFFSWNLVAGSLLFHAASKMGVGVFTYLHTNDNQY